jgi:hypothetical protein
MAKTRVFQIGLLGALSNANAEQLAAEITVE